LLWHCSKYGESGGRFSALGDWSAQKGDLAGLAHRLQVLHFLYVSQFTALLPTRTKIMRITSVTASKVSDYGKTFFCLGHNWPVRRKGDHEGRRESNNILF
jgi:hypothetical protein